MHCEKGTSTVLPVAPAPGRGWEKEGLGPFGEMNSYLQSWKLVQVFPSHPTG